jgi:Ca2+/H+ antiporter, TMEM165/GDT1 family
MFYDLIIPFIVIFLAELGDKTQIAIFCLSSRTKKYFYVFLGSFFAFFLANGIAVFFGGIISNLIHKLYLDLALFFLFIIFGIVSLRKSKEKKVLCELKSPFLSSFGIIFLAELGDKSQIASIVFAATYNPILVFIGVMTALSILTIFAIYLGNTFMKKFNHDKVNFFIGILFILLGFIKLISIIGNFIF